MLIILPLTFEIGVCLIPARYSSVIKVHSLYTEQVDIDLAMLSRSTCMSG